MKDCCQRFQNISLSSYKDLRAQRVLCIAYQRTCSAQFYLCVKYRIVFQFEKIGSIIHLKYDVVSQSVLLSCFVLFIGCILLLLERQFGAVASSVGKISALLTLVGEQCSAGKLIKWYVCPSQAALNGTFLLREPNSIIGVWGYNSQPTAYRLEKYRIGYRSIYI